MSDDIFDRYAAYYDLLYRDKDYAAEADYVASALRRAAPAARTVLELGSGSGRHGRLLARHGFDVLGVERSESMVALAQRTRDEFAAADNSGTFTCVQGDMRQTRLGRTFDAVISLFHVVSYQTTRDDLTQTFAGAASHLRPGGVFLFDVWHGPAVLCARPSVRVKRAEDANTRLWRIAEPQLDAEVNIVTVQYTMLAESRGDGRLTTFQEQHRMRYLFPTEIDLFAANAGFDVETSEEFLTGNAPSDQTWGVAYVLRKTNQ